jgi:hypothetical protein
MKLYSTFRKMSTTFAKKFDDLASEIDQIRPGVTTEMTQRELAALFRKLGAPDPETWARSQLQEKIPQLARFLFLRQAWRHIIGEEDATWIDARIARAEQESNEPFASVGLALKKLRARGAVDDEIIDLVRGMQAGLLFS